MPTMSNDLEGSIELNHLLSHQTTCRARRGVQLTQPAIIDGGLQVIITR